MYVTCRLTICMFTLFLDDYMASPFVKERLCRSSPARQPPCYADRFIPSRVATELVGRFASLTSFGSGSEETQENISIGKDSGGDIVSARERRVCTSLLRNEVLGEVASNVRGAERVKKDETGSSKMLRYRSPIKSQSSWSPYSLSPVSKSSQWLLLSPRKSARKIPKAPFKILDAPDLQDDFYLNLLDWSSQNVLSVGLGSSATFGMRALVK